MTFTIFSINFFQLMLFWKLSIYIYSIFSHWFTKLSRFFVHQTQCENLRTALDEWLHTAHLYATSKYMPAKYWSYLSGIHQLHLINFCHYCKFAWIHVASCSSIVLGWQSFAQKCRGSEIWTRAWWGFCHKSYQLGCENVSHLWWFWWFRFVVVSFRVDQLGEVDASNISGNWSLEKVRTRTTMKNEPQLFLLFTNRFVVESFSLAPNFGIFMVFMLPNDSKLQEKQKSRRRDCLESVTHSFPCDKGRCLLHIGYICWRIFFEVFFWVSRDGRICSARMTKASELHHKVLHSAIKQGIKA